MIFKINVPSTLILIVLVSVIISGCYKPPDERDKKKVTFNLRFENINTRKVEGTNYWDIMVSIDSVDIEEEGNIPLWMNIRVWIEKEDGSGSHLDKYKPALYNYTPTNEPETFYEDLTGVPGEIDIGDVFTITGLDRSFENAQFHIYYGGKDAGSIRFPDEFS